MRPADGDRIEDADADRAGTRILRLIAALILVNGLLLAPVWIVPGSDPAPWIALEACMLVCLFAASASARPRTSSNSPAMS